MTAEPDSIPRGLYGPVPDRLVPRRHLWRRILAARTAFALLPPQRLVLLIAVYFDIRSRWVQ